MLFQSLEEVRSALEVIQVACHWTSDSPAYNFFKEPSIERESKVADEVLSRASSGRGLASRDLVHYLIIGAVSVPDATSAADLPSSASGRRPLLIREDIRNVDA